MNERPVWAMMGKAEPSEAVVAYCAGYDVVERPAADTLLLAADVMTNQAHRVMLARTGIVPAPAAADLAGALRRLEALVDEDEFELDPVYEDVHMNIESWLGHEVGGEAAGWLHTARSRNDQVATDMRIYLRRRVLFLQAAVLGLVDALLNAAEGHLETPLPGFTHHRHGAISTVAHWCTAHAQALLRDSERLAGVFERVNRSPLGAVAGYGTSWQIDRDLCARLLGFAGVEANTLDPISTRWETEADVGGAACILINHLSTLAQDMILFSTEEYGLLRLPADLTTGSSVMPQKRNPDFAEVTKARAATAGGHLSALLSLSRGNLSGYNRDTQWTKYLIMDLLGEVEAAPGIMSLVVERVEWDREALLASVGRGFLYAVDLADGLSQEFDLPFRRAYRAVGAAVEAARAAGRGDVELEDLLSGLKDEAADAAPDAAWLARFRDWKHNLLRRSHYGGPAPESERGVIDTLRQQREAAGQQHALREKNLAAAAAARSEALLALQK